jgi:hypothetical protein
MLISFMIKEQREKLDENFLSCGGEMDWESVASRIAGDK